MQKCAKLPEKLVDSIINDLVVLHFMLNSANLNTYYNLAVSQGNLLLIFSKKLYHLDHFTLQDKRK